MDQAQGIIGFHLLRREIPVQRKNDVCKGRHLFGSDVTIWKRFLDSYINPPHSLVENNTKSVRVQENGAMCNFVGSLLIEQVFKHLRILYLVVRKYKL